VIDTLQALLGAHAIAESSFGPNSRYYNVPLGMNVAPDGTEIRYVKRRFIPPENQFATLGLHRVMPSERIDLIAAQRLGDPLLYWRICDANPTLRPDALLVVGAYLRIALAAGVPGAAS
jgi:hypothetical protein